MKQIKIKNGKKIKQKDLRIYEDKCKYDFQQYETIRSSGKSIYIGKTNLAEAKIDQSSLLKFGRI